jgi:hypothetical protein
LSPITLDYQPREWQRKCHLVKARFKVLALHRRSGKTELAVMELISAALRCTKDLGGFFYLAPQLKQAKAIAWRRLKKKVEPLELQNAVDINESELTVMFKHNGATIRLFGADNPDAMRGMRMDGIVIDEVAQIAPEVWFDIIRPALSDRLGWAIFIGTPKGVNLFSELYYQAQTLKDWYSVTYTVYETDSLDPGEVEKIKATSPPQSFAREYLCDFAAAGDDQLISIADAEEAARRGYSERDLLTAATVIGVDPARFGDDRSVIFRRQGLQAFTPQVYRGADNMELASRVAYFIGEWKPEAVFIDAGSGAGVIDRLRQLDQDVIEVPFGGRAVLHDKFLNRRVEMWTEMADWLHAGGAIPNDIELKQELATPTYWFDAQGRRVLEAKEDIKKRLKGGKSPDLADALALTFAHQVKKRTPMQEFHAQRPRDPRGHNPLDLMRRRR